MWYRLSRIAPKGKRIAPSVMRNRMTKIASAARRLISLKVLDGLACYPCCRIGGDPILAALTE